MSSVISKPARWHHGIAKEPLGIYPIASLFSFFKKKEQNTARVLSFKKEEERESYIQIGEFHVSNSYKKCISQDEKRKII
jgi:hypothetical protein